MTDEESEVLVSEVKTSDDGGEQEDEVKAKKPEGKAVEEAGKIGCAPDILSKAAMQNAYFICHNVQDLMHFRGFPWDGVAKGKGRGKKRKK